MCDVVGVRAQSLPMAESVDSDAWQAARTDDVDAVRSAAAGGWHVNAVSAQGQTALTEACRHGADKVVDWLCRNGADVHACDQDGVSPLMMAAYMGHVGIMERLADTAELRLDDQAADGSTALIAAVIGRSQGSVEWLLKAGADANVTNQGGLTAMAVALLERKWDVAAALQQRTTWNPGSLVPMDHLWLYASTGPAAALWSARVVVRGETAWMRAAASNQADVVALYLAAGADKDAVDETNWTALHFAAHGNHVAVVQTLLDGGANAGIRTHDGDFTALMVAVLTGAVDCVRLLATHAACVDAVNVINGHMQSALSLALTHHRAAAAELLEAGADLSTVSDDPSVQLVEVCRCGDRVIPSVRRLLAQRSSWEPAIQRRALEAAINAGGQSLLRLLALVTDASADDLDPVLRLALDSDKVWAVRTLLAAGASANAASAGGAPPLVRACELRLPDCVAALLMAGGAASASNAIVADGVVHSLRIVRMLLDHGADAQACDDTGRPVISIAAAAGCGDVVRLLLDRGASPETPPDVLSPLHAAAERGHAAVLDMLLKHGCAVNRPDAAGSTPLALAAAGGHVDAVVCLLREHAEMDVVNRAGNSALMAACAAGHATVVQLLLRAGASTHVVNSAGRNALALAAAAGHKTAVRCLLATDADVDAACGEGMTAASLAAAGGHLEVVKCLVNAGASLVTRKGGVCITPLLASLAAERGDVTGWLLRNAPELVHDGRHSNGWTTLHYAAASRSPTLLRRMLEAAGTVAVASTSQARELGARAWPALCTPLHCALIAGNEDAALAWLRVPGLRGSFNAATADGRTPLHLAVQALSKPCVESLLKDAHADAAVRDATNRTPLDYLVDVDGDPVKEVLCQMLKDSLTRRNAAIPLPMTAADVVTDVAVREAALDASWVLIDEAARLGEGATSVVHRGTLTRPDGAGPVAVAVKRVDLSRLPGGERDFWREVIMHRKCSTSPRIARCYGGWVDGAGAAGGAASGAGRGCMVMERCESALTDPVHAPTTSAHRLRRCLQLLQALLYLHTKDVVHGDIKPSNMLLDPAGDIKLADFGTCALRHESTTRSVDALYLGERGSPRYMCPAVALGECAFNKPSDVFSCAVSMWEVLQNTLRSEDPPPAALLPLTQVQLHQRAKWLRDNSGRGSLTEDDLRYRYQFYCSVQQGWRQPPRCNDVPADVVELVHHMWSSDPVSRPTAREAHDVLQAICHRQGITTAPAPLALELSTESSGDGAGGAQPGAECGSDADDDEL